MCREANHAPFKASHQVFNAVFFTKLSLRSSRVDDIIMSIRTGLKLSGVSPVHSLLALLASYVSWPLSHLLRTSRGQTSSPLPVFT